jgi:phospholipid-transporting ATPase
MLNSVRARVKLSTLDRMTSSFVVLIFIFLLIICTSLGLIYATWEFKQGELVARYLSGYNRSYFYNFVVRTLNYMLIFGNFVPISMLITLEIAKFAQGHIMSLDKAMISESGFGCEVHSSNLNEEIGQIDYIFSDKTGTLTRNDMRFRYLIVDDMAYGEQKGYSGNLPNVTNVEFSDPRIWQAVGQGRANGNPQRTKIKRSLNLLAVCHTVVAEKDGTYNASSPDELAFVNFAKLVGCEFIGADEDNNMVVNEFGTMKVYKLLDIIEFSSERKRMSVIVKDESGKVIIYTKGADSIMIPRYVPSEAAELQRVRAKLDEFSNIGLRTLLLGYRELTPQQYQSFKSEYDVTSAYSGCQE